MAINHERQQSCGTNQVISQVMVTQMDNSQAVIPADNSQHEVPASFMNAVGFQTQSFGGKRFNNQKKQFYCTSCNNNRHTVDSFYKKHSYPPNNKFQGKPGGFGSNGGGFNQMIKTGNTSFSDPC